MKKIIKVIIIVLAILAVLIGIFFGYKHFFKTGNEDALKFKKEYSSLEIKQNNPVTYLTDKNIVQELESGDKLIFFGRPESLKTQVVIETLLKVLEDNGVELLYYYNLSKGNEELVKQIENQIKDVKFDDSTLILIKKGNVEKYYINEKEDLNKNDRKELYDAYEDIIVSFIMCSSNC